MDELTERRQVVLGLVVREHIASAMPVSSRAVVEQYGLNISSATVRNEMAYLERHGYLMQPHTSAGRIPTEKGYRYFVQRLMEEAQLPPAEQRMIRHQFHQVRLDMERWMKLATAVLARTTRGAALVTKPQTARGRFKHLELVSTHGPMVLLVLVLEGGVVKQELLTLAEPLSQDELSRTANRLNHLFTGLRAGEIRTRFHSLKAFESEMGSLVIGIMEEADSHASGDVYHDGLANILRQPEFAEVESARQVLRILEERSFLEAILGEVLSTSGVQVIIGGEGRWDELSSCSMVLSRYGVSSQAMGALGIIGPMRMAYGRAIGTVRYVSDLMSGLVGELFGD